MLSGKVQVAKLMDGQLIGLHSRVITGPADVTTGPNLAHLIQIPIQRSVWIVPLAEEPMLPLDFLAPLAVAVWKQGKFRIWFFGLAAVAITPIPP